MTVQNPINEELHCDNETEFRLAMMKSSNDVVVDDGVEILCVNDNPDNYDTIRFDSTKRNRTLKLNGTVKFDGNMYITLRGTTLVLGQNGKLQSAQKNKTLLAVFNSKVLLADDPEAMISTDKVSVSLIENRFVFEIDAGAGSNITINKPEVFSRYFDTLIIREIGTQNLLVNIDEALIGNKYDVEIGKNIAQDFYLDIDSSTLTNGQATPRITLKFSENSTKPIDTITFEGDVVLKKDIADHYIAQNGANLYVEKGATFGNKTYEEKTKLFYDGENWTDVDILAKPVEVTNSNDFVKYLNSGYKDITVSTAMTLSENATMANDSVLKVKAELTIASGSSLTVGNELIGIENIHFADETSKVIMTQEGTIKDSQNNIVATINQIDSNVRWANLSINNWSTNNQQYAIRGTNISYAVTDSKIFSFIDLSSNGSLMYNGTLVASSTDSNALFGMNGDESFVRVISNSYNVNTGYSYNLGSGVVIQNDTDFGFIGVMQGEGSIITIGNLFTSNNENYKNYFFDKDIATGIIPQANQTFKAIDKGNYNFIWVLQ